MVGAFEKSYTFDVKISGDSVIVKLQGLRDSDESGGYSIKLRDIESVSDEVLSLEWLPLSYASGTNPSQGPEFRRTAQSPVVKRRVLYTEGQFVNPSTHNPAFLHYKHGDRCVTITLKEPQSLTLGSRVGAIQGALEFRVKEFSFEVLDKSAAKDLILSAMNPR